MMGGLERPYLVWSKEHGAWWGPGRHGYVSNYAMAGRYTHDEAIEICVEAMRPLGGTFQEVPVRLEDVEHMRARWRHRFGKDWPLSRPVV